MSEVRRCFLKDGVLFIDMGSDGTFVYEVCT